MKNSLVETMLGKLGSPKKTAQLLANDDGGKFVALSFKYQVLAYIGLIYYFATGIGEIYLNRHLFGLILQMSIGSIGFAFAWTGLRFKWHVFIFAYAVWHALMALLSMVGSVMVFLHLVYDMWTEHIDPGVLRYEHLGMTIIIGVYFVISSYFSFRTGSHVYHAKNEKWSALQGLEIPISTNTHIL